MEGLQIFSKSVIAALKKEFNDKLERLLSRKKSNSAYFISRSRYEDFITEINVIKSKYNKDFEDYKMLNNYDVIETNGRRKLVKPKDDSSSNVKFYVATDELFGVLHTMHILFNHANKDVMDSEIKTKYCNVSKEVIKLYLSCLKFMLSRNGERLLKLGDFTFTRRFSQGTRCNWVCYTHNEHGCQATAYTEHNDLLYANNEHNHPPTEFFV
ncbi:unnamed protein product [Diatraea saccharalis]|uniref:FLYWCH-type domain-containing protein n=1 Tax=Diatraea saccharalis TaxID=40085 RepID=A0A9N9R160_9NEOP|nr:unnamed protein product [Diatraea saccharalis]